jgi:hypothetical protein
LNPANTNSRFKKPARKPLKPEILTWTL